MARLRESVKGAMPRRERRARLLRVESGRHGCAREAAVARIGRLERVLPALLAVDLPTVLIVVRIVVGVVRSWSPSTASPESTLGPGLGECLGQGDHHD